MGIPPEFRRLAERFHQDILRTVASEAELVAHAVRGMTAEEKRVVKRYLTKMLDSDPTDAAFRNLWRKTNKDIFFGKGVRQFFVRVRDAL